MRILGRFKGTPVLWGVVQPGAKLEASLPIGQTAIDLFSGSSLTVDRSIAVTGLTHEVVSVDL